MRPHLDYIFHVPHKVGQLGLSLSNIMEEIEKVQYKAALAITGAWQGSNRSKLYEELGWESLSDRRITRRLLMMYKIVNNHTPDYLTEKLPPMGRAQVAILSLFRNIDVGLTDSCIAFFLMAQDHGTLLCRTSQQCPQFKH